MKKDLKEKKKQRDWRNEEMNIKDYAKKKKIEKKIITATNNLDFASAIYFNQLLKMIKNDKNINKKFVGGIEK